MKSKLQAANMSSAMALYAQLKQSFIQAFTAVCGSVDSTMIEVTRSRDPKFGDYQCNAAMRLAKVFKIPPRELAQKALEKLDDPCIAATSIDGPGFINIILDNAFMSRMAQDAFCRPDWLKTAQKKRVVIDFSSPNTAKEMHVGHLRSTIIGDALARALELVGHDVVRLNHVGDWGTAFGMLIAFFEEEGVDAFADIAFLQDAYKKAKARFDTDEAFKKRSQLCVVALQGGQMRARQLWERICDVSRQSYQEIYRKLDISICERGESTYNSALKPTVERLDALGLLQEDDGAKCIFLDGFLSREGTPLPLIVQKSDGGYNYASTDLAAISQRIFEEKAQWLIYVTDAGQAVHFAQVFAAAKKASWLTDAIRVDHVGFGLVLGPDGKKFRTRSGQTERLMDLIEEGIDRARSILKERDFPADADIEATAQALGINALKYADLSCNRTGDYQFSYDKSLRFDGNTAAFLMYSYVRICSILRQSGSQRDPISAKDPSERVLILKLLQFPEALQSMLQELLPNRLADYLYDLACVFNAFFRDCRVRGVSEEASRLTLVELSAHVLGTGMQTLGLKLVERM